MTYILGDSALGLPNAGSGLVYITSSTFSAASTVSIDGCFGASFTNYRVIVDLTSSASTALYYRMRVAGSDNSASSYQYQYVLANNATVSAARGTDTQAYASNLTASARASFCTELLAPAVATATAWQTHSVYDAASSYFLASFGYHNVATAYDGFTLLPTSGTISGSVSVYGYRLS